MEKKKLFKKINGFLKFFFVILYCLSDRRFIFYVFFEIRYNKFFNFILCLLDILIPHIERGKKLKYKSLFNGSKYLIC